MRVRVVVEFSLEERQLIGGHVRPATTQDARIWIENLVREHLDRLARVEQGTQRFEVTMSGTPDQSEMLERIAFHFVKALKRAQAGEYADSAEQFRTAMRGVRELHASPEKARAFELADAVDHVCLVLWQHFRNRRARNLVRGL